LDGYGQVERFAEYSQWEEWQRSQQLKLTAATENRSRRETANSAPIVAKKRLSYLEAREYAAIEAAIEEAEQELRAKLAALHDPAIMSDAPRLQVAMSEVEQAQKAVDRLYARWSELEAKQS